MAEPVLQTWNLTRRFGNLLAVDDLSLEIQPGEIFGLLGPNGAGKTTTINMICGLLKPDSGKISIGGKMVGSGDASVRLRVGICPQQTILWEKLTCLEQIEFIGEMYNLPRREARRRGEELLEALGLHEQRNRLASVLSGGMQRRLNLALALVHDPQILVLDEPEAGLDPQSRVLVRDYVKSLARRKTILLTTHNMDEAERLADRVAIIDHGRLLVLDNPENLKAALGQGDVLELETSGAIPDSMQAAFCDAGYECTFTKNSLILRAHRMIEHIPAVLQRLQGCGVQVNGMRLRANSLEDVFIALTGRRLRE